MPEKNDSPVRSASVPLPTTTDDLQGLLFVDVWSATKPSLGGLLGLSRPATYASIAAGTWPVQRAGRRIRVHVPSLLASMATTPRED